MSKRLILVLTFAFVVAFSMAAYAEVQNVKVSGDITVLGIDRSQFGLKHKAGLKTETAAATITRVKVDADLTDNVMATVRLLNERYWGTENENTGFDSNSVLDVDLAYVTMKEFLYSPLTLRVGRQELHFGNDMIVGAAGTNNTAPSASPFSVADPDLTVRKAFDAIRATLNYDPLTIDLIAAKVTERILKNNDDTNLFGVNANYKLNKTTTAEAYLFMKSNGKKALATGAASNSKADKIYVPGARLVAKPTDEFTLQGEAAYQFGTFNTTANQPVSRRAWAAEAAATYDFTKVKYTPSATLLAAYFSGKKDPNNTGITSKHYNGWDPMFENQKFGDIANAQFSQSNARIAGGIVTAKLVEDVILKGEYYAFWWDKVYLPGDVVTTARGDTVVMNANKSKRFAGQEVDLTATYNYTEDVQFNVLGGMFVPGAAFDKSNRSKATEVIGSMKVTF
ncbi:MAG: alginate export family protein [Candidatus Omnitrophica bacterium]|nr:alginate export family protein [Candidatus Omnitrophota bacterium]